MTLTKRIDLAPVQRVDISKIEVGERRREKKHVRKDLAVLRKSMEELGLIHPVVISQDLRLAAGERRLTAAKLLGWKTIPARVVQMDDEELRAVELDENEARLDLDAVESAAIRLREIEELEEEAERRVREQASRAGQPAKDTERRVAHAREAAVRASGVPRQTRHRDRRLVGAAQRYPFMERWAQRPIEKVSAELDNLGRRDKERVKPVLAILEPREATSAAQEILRCYTNFESYAPKSWDKILKRAKSNDPEQRRRAITDALRVPPAPDKRLAHIQSAIASAKKARDLKKGDEGCAWIIDGINALEEAYRVIKSGYDEALKDFHDNIKERTA